MFLTVADASTGPPQTGTIGRLRQRIARLKQLVAQLEGEPAADCRQCVKALREAKDVEAKQREAVAAAQRLVEEAEVQLQQVCTNAGSGVFVWDGEGWAAGPNSERARWRQGQAFGVGGSQWKLSIASIVALDRRAGRGGR